MRKLDFVFAAVVLLFAGCLFLIQTSMRVADGQGTVAVYREKERIAAYPLSEDREETFADADGGVNRLVVRGGEAWIEDADCPDGLCIRQGRISRDGQAITCLPHKLVVTVEGGGEREVDALVR